MPRNKQTQTIHSFVYLNAMTIPKIVVTKSPMVIKTINQRKGTDEGGTILPSAHL